MLKHFSKYPLLLLLAVSMIPLLLYHNCSDVSLAPADYSSLKPSAAYASVPFCTPANFELASFYGRNLNGLVRDGVLKPDSDADGLDDGTELTMGSSPIDRRSSGRLIDSICYELTGTVNCHSAAINCTGAENELSVSDCDVTALGLDKITGHPVQGLESDMDGVPDLLEILSGTFANIVDATDDPDHDFVLNAQEIARGSNPR